MDNEKRERMLEQVRKAMGLRDGATSQGEAEAAAAGVRRLLLKLGIDEAQAKQETKASEQMTGRLPWLDVKKGKTEWEGILAQVIGTACMCFPVAEKGGITFSGHHRDVEACLYLYAQLVVRFNDMSRLATTAEAQRLTAEIGRNSWHAMGLAYFKKFRRSYLRGCADGMYRRLEAERKHDAESEVTAIVIVSRTALAKTQAELVYPNMKPGRVSGKVGNGDAYHKGIEAAETIEMRKGITE